MRFLFSATPAYGPVLALSPLARAARRAGHEVAFLTARQFQSTIALEVGGQVPVIGDEQGFPELVSACVYREGFHAFSDPTPGSMTALLAGVRVDMGLRPAVGAARSWAPDVVICDSLDLIGPLVASALDVPYSTYAFGPDVDGEFAALLDEHVNVRYTREGLRRHLPLATIDPNPTALQGLEWTPAPNRLPLGTDIGPLAPALSSPGSFEGTDYRWSVLVSLGTTIPDMSVLSRVVTALDKLPVNTLATATGPAWAKLPDATANRVFTPFAPIDTLLKGQDVIVSAAGAGTVLAAISSGIPMVLLPRTAEQRGHAKRVAATGAGIVIETPEDAAPAIRVVMNDPAYARAARMLQCEVSLLPLPDAVISSLADLMTRKATTDASPIRTT